MDGNMLMYFSDSHSSHISRWMLTGSTVSHICLACVGDVLGDAGMPSFRQKALLQELEASMSKRNVQLLLSDDPDLCLMLFVRLIEAASAKRSHPLYEESVSIIVKVISLARKKEVVYSVVDELLSRTCRVRSQLDTGVHLDVLCKLQSVLPEVIGSALVYYQGVDRLLHFFESSDLEVEESYLVDFLYLVSCSSKSNREGISALPDSLVPRLIAFVLRIIDSSVSSILLSNAAAALSGILLYSNCFMVLQVDDRISPVGRSLVIDALKKLLLSSDISTRTFSLVMLKCFCTEATTDNPIISKLLRCSVFELLMEFLSSQSVSVIRLASVCLCQLVRSEDFFNKGHATYGIRNLVSLVDAHHGSHVNPKVLLPIVNLMGALGEAGLLMKAEVDVATVTSALGVLRHKLRCHGNGVALQSLQVISTWLKWADLMNTSLSETDMAELVETCIQTYMREESLFDFKTQQEAASGSLVSIFSLVDIALRWISHHRQVSSSTSQPDDHGTLPILFSRKLLGCWLGFLTRCCHAPSATEAVCSATMVLKRLLPMEKDLALSIVSAPVLEVLYGLKERLSTQSPDCSHAVSTSTADFLFTVINVLTLEEEREWVSVAMRFESHLTTSPHNWAALIDNLPNCSLHSTPWPGGSPSSINKELGMVICISCILDANRLSGDPLFLPPVMLDALHALTNQLLKHTEYPVGTAIQLLRVYTSTVPRLTALELKTFTTVERCMSSLAQSLLERHQLVRELTGIVDWLLVSGIDGSSKCRLIISCMTDTSMIPVRSGLVAVCLRHPTVFHLLLVAACYCSDTALETDRQLSERGYDLSMISGHAPWLLSRIGKILINIGCQTDALQGLLAKVTRSLVDACSDLETCADYFFKIILHFVDLVNRTQSQTLRCTIWLCLNACVCTCVLVHLDKAVACLRQHDVLLRHLSQCFSDSQTSTEDPIPTLCLIGISSFLSLQPSLQTDNSVLHSFLYNVPSWTDTDMWVCHVAKVHLHLSSLSRTPHSGPPLTEQEQQQLVTLLSNLAVADCVPLSRMALSAAAWLIRCASRCSSETSLNGWALCLLNELSETGSSWVEDKLYEVLQFVSAVIAVRWRTPSDYHVLAGVLSVACASQREPCWRLHTSVLIETVLVLAEKNPSGLPDDLHTFIVEKTTDINLVDADAVLTISYCGVRLVPSTLLYSKNCQEILRKAKDYVINSSTRRHNELSKIG